MALGKFIHDPWMKIGSIFIAIPSVFLT